MDFLFSDADFRIQFLSGMWHGTTRHAINERPSRTRTLLGLTHRLSCNSRSAKSRDEIQSCLKLERNIACRIIANKTTTSRSIHIQSLISAYAYVCIRTQGYFPKAKLFCKVKIHGDEFHGEKCASFFL